MKNEKTTTYPFLSAPRCTATSKRTGNRCGSPAEKFKTVCRFHGAMAGAPSGAANGAFKHGKFTCEAIAVRKLITDARRSARDALTSGES